MSRIGPSQIFTDLQVGQFPAFVRLLMFVKFIYKFRISTYFIRIIFSPST